jgi:predicted transposase YbfD/YdcC
MDRLYCTGLLAFLREVPDPRKPRGQRYPWWFLLAIICGGLVDGHTSGRAIAQWAAENAEGIVSYLQISLPRMPSASTIRRVLQLVDVERLEQQIAAYLSTLDAASPEAGSVEGNDGERIRGLAVDGKAVRGANAHGAQVHLVSCVRHESGITLAQSKVDEKTNEIGAVPELLASQDLHGILVTVDALLTQRALAEQILAQGGEYLMLAKGNQPTLQEDIATLFQDASARADCEAYHSKCRGHGRQEEHSLSCSTALQSYLEWPGARQVFERRRDCLHLKSQARSQEVTYGVTSLGPERVGAKGLETFARWHWTIEDRSHYVRDETLKEDRCQMHTGHAPQALAAFRNAIIALLRTQGQYDYIPDAQRHYQAHLQETLQLIGLRRL